MSCRKFAILLRLVACVLACGVWHSAFAINEGSTFTVAAGDVYKFGSSKWAYHQYSTDGTGVCSTATFGDPEYGVSKSCAFVTTCYPGKWNSSTLTCDVCPDGYTKQSDGTCKKPTCVVGETGTGTQYRGLATGTDWTSSAGYPTTVCDGTCTVNATTVVSCWAAHTSSDKSDWPAPAWCSFTGTKTGDTCEYSDSDPAPTYTSDDTNSGETADTGATGGGSSGSGSTDSGSGTSDSGDDTGSSGSGSGSGTSTSSGTDSGTGTGSTTGTGETSIDETGTPTGLADGTGDLTDVGDELIDALNDQAKQSELPWSLSFTLPEGSCNALHWSVLNREFDLNVCPFLEKCRTAWGYCLYGLCAMYLWRRATGAVGSQGGA